jgi:hypothetical protein
MPPGQQQAPGAPPAHAPAAPEPHVLSRWVEEFSNGIFKGIEEDAQKRFEIAWAAKALERSSVELFVRDELRKGVVRVVNTLANSNGMLKLDPLTEGQALAFDPIRFGVRSEDAEERQNIAALKTVEGLLVQVIGDATSPNAKPLTPDDINRLKASAYAIDPFNPKYNDPKAQGYDATYKAAFDNQPASVGLKAIRR